ncbi:hypothetical protein AGMMS49940_01380 [Spirochaetia bacterium]|nr:hypothetical protein AGMMS49940_01380 [Spirochaetia bacterium]
MSRAEELEDLKGKLRGGHIYECRDELEDFLSKDSDDFTGRLQEAIDDKLENPGFYHRNFSDFLNDYQRNNPDDSAGYFDMCVEIYGKEDDDE